MAPATATAIAGARNRTLESVARQHREGDAGDLALRVEAEQKT
jgi:hypothetical protein